MKSLNRQKILRSIIRQIMARTIKKAFEATNGGHWVIINAGEAN